MKLSLQEIMDYQKCPMLHKFRWVDRVDVSVSEKRKVPNRWHIVEEFDKALHHVVYGIFHQLGDGSYPNAHYVKQRWGKVWNQKRTKEDVLFDTGSWRNEHRKKERQGLNALLVLHKDFSNAPGTPILIGKGYEIQVGKHTVTGVIDLVREVRDESDKPIIEIMDFKTDDRPTSLHVKGDMEVTAASMAFRKLFGYTEHRITYHGTLTKKQVHTTRSEKDYRLLEIAVDNVAKGIENNIYYPVLNSKCFECPFQKHCEKKEWFG